MSEKFNPDSFNTFLQNVTAPASPSLQSLLSRPSLLAILSAMAGQAGEPTESGSLMSMAAVPDDEFASDLKQLESQQLITRELRGGREYIRLTDDGRKLVGSRV
jgi:hypothetical protein